MEVHIGVQATGLLPILLGVAAGRGRVSGHRVDFKGSTEKPERVEVAAPQRPGDLILDHGVGRCSPEPQRDTIVTHRAAAVNHRPLVQPKAIQSGRTLRGRLQQAGHERDGVHPAAQVGGAGRDAVAILGIAAAAPIATDRFAAGEHHPVAGVPAAQLPWPQAVVAEQEVPHRMGLTNAGRLTCGATNVSARTAYWAARAVHC